MKPSSLFSFFLSILLFTATLQSNASAPFHVSVSGKGKRAAILIPGFTCSGTVWDATVAQLSKTYTCHVITFPGFAGESAQADPHLSQWVGDIAAYIRTQHLDKPVIIGHSIGGGMAMMLAADYPELVARIVVVDALPCLGALQNPAYKADAHADCSRFINTYTAMSDSALLAQQTHTTTMLCADSSRQAQIVQWSMQSDRKTMGQIYCEFMNTDLRDTIAQVKCPALILLEPSFKMYEATMQQQFAKLAGAQIVYAQKGLHFIMYDDREWYLGQINSYLR